MHYQLFTSYICILNIFGKKDFFKWRYSQHLTIDCLGILFIKLNLGIEFNELNDKNHIKNTNQIM